MQYIRLAYLSIKTSSRARQHGNHYAIFGCQLSERNATSYEQSRLVDRHDFRYVQDGVDADFDVELGACFRDLPLEVLELENLVILQNHPRSLVTLSVRDFEDSRASVEDRLAETCSKDIFRSN